MQTAATNSGATLPRPVPAAPVKVPGIASASIPETLTALHVDPETGLTRAEVDVRRKEHGYNEVAVQKGHAVRKFLAKFWGLSAWMLELIMVLSLVLRKYSDLAVVSALLVVNAILSFVQEHRAAGVVETLRQRLQVSARVKRDSSWQVIPARELVPGDIVRVRQGDIIPADVKLLKGSLSLDQSALTGESKNAEKASGGVLSSGSIVRRGEGNGVVMLTGAKTYFGRTTELVQQARPKLHIEAVVAKVVRWLFVIVGTLLAAVVVMSLIRGAPLVEMVPLMLVLLMSAVPVALPVMFTVSMAVGSKELAKRGVLVTRLSAAEDAATMEVLCVDKTGTITMIRQQRKDGTPFVEAIAAAGIIPGIKVDTGAKDMAGYPGEKITEGLDGLRDRLADYSHMGARFAKWRAVIALGDGIPSAACIEANAQALARYAALCQEAGLVPIVEPEVLMDGAHTLERSSEVTEQVLRMVFHQLYVQGVTLEGLILKPNMVLPGLTCPKRETVDEAADATMRCLLRAVPAAMPGVAFLSGGQSAELASARLNAMNVRFKSRLPWALAFSFARAIQQPALEIWQGNETHVVAAQQALLHRARCNRAARRGGYTAAMEGI